MGLIDLVEQPVAIAPLPHAVSAGALPRTKVSRRLPQLCRAQVGPAAVLVVFRGESSHRVVGRGGGRGALDRDRGELVEGHCGVVVNGLDEVRGGGRGATGSIGADDHDAVTQAQTTATDVQRLVGGEVEDIVTVEFNTGCHSGHTNMVNIPTPLAWIPRRVVRHQAPAQGIHTRCRAGGQRSGEHHLRGVGRDGIDGKQGRVSQKGWRCHAGPVDQTNS
mmetsp:Transcript_11149/g.24556  ORF Transcript_11149/g.24556 Transcript_11149/m.24556 type:complete len:220 (+) Transcript_11149:568-1227(+)